MYRQTIKAFAENEYLYFIPQKYIWKKAYFLEGACARSGMNVAKLSQLPGDDADRMPTLLGRRL